MNAEEREALSAQIADDIKAFCALGGKINVLPNYVGEYRDMRTAKDKDAAEKGAESRRNHGRWHAKTKDGGRKNRERWNDGGKGIM